MKIDIIKAEPLLRLLFRVVVLFLLIIVLCNLAKQKKSLDRVQSALDDIEYEFRGIYTVVKNIDSEVGGISTCEEYLEQFDVVKDYKFIRDLSERKMKQQFLDSHSSSNTSKVPDIHKIMEDVLAKENNKE